MPYKTFAQLSGDDGTQQQQMDQRIQSVGAFDRNMRDVYQSHPAASKMQMNKNSLTQPSSQGERMNCQGGSCSLREGFSPSSHHSSLQGMMNNQPQFQGNPSGSRLLEIRQMLDKQQLVGNNRVVVLMVHADWCGYCKKAMPAFEQLAALYSRPGALAFCRENANLNLTQGVGGVPAFFIFVEGKLAHKINGAKMQELQEAFSSYL